MDSLGTIVGLLCIGSFLLLFVAGGVYLIVTSVRSRRKAQASQSWPSVTGRVLAADIVEYVSRDEDKTTRSYHLAVQYEYEVNGQRYVGDKVNIGPVRRNINPRRSQEILARYPVGGNVTVYYNPVNPQEAVLERAAAHTTAILVLGIALILVPSFIACLLLVTLVLSTLSSSGG